MRLTEQARPMSFWRLGHVETWEHGKHEVKVPSEPIRTVQRKKANIVSEERELSTGQACLAGQIPGASPSPPKSCRPARTPTRHHSLAAPRSNSRLRDRTIGDSSAFIKLSVRPFSFFCTLYRVWSHSISLQLYLTILTQISLLWHLVDGQTYRRANVAKSCNFTVLRRLPVDRSARR